MKMLAVIVLLSLHLANSLHSVNGICSIRPRFRGRFNILHDPNLSEMGELTVRKDSMVATQNGQEKSFKCIDSDSVSTYLLKSSDGQHVICLQFADMADTDYEFSLFRRSIGGSNDVFDTTAMNQDASVKNSCGNFEGPLVNLRRSRSSTPQQQNSIYDRCSCSCVTYKAKNVYAKFGRLSPGCEFPSILRKTWRHDSDHITSMTFGTNSLKVNFINGKQLTFVCERLDKKGRDYNIAMRSSAIRQYNDGVLCLQLRPQTGGYKTVISMKRLNSPGCEFPSILRKTWRHDNDKITSMTFGTNSLKVNFINGKQLTFVCERLDKEGRDYKIAMRSSAIRQYNDGVLCLQLRPQTGGYKTVISMKRLNTGKIKLISRFEPIYLHRTCDLIDNPVNAGTLSEIGP